MKKTLLIIFLILSFAATSFALDFSLRLNPGAAIPLKESEKMRIGYIKRKNSSLSEIGSLYVEELSHYEKNAYNKKRGN